MGAHFTVVENSLIYYSYEKADISLRLGNIRVSDILHIVYKKGNPIEGFGTMATFILW